MLFSCLSEEEEELAEEWKTNRQDDEEYKSK